MSSSSSKSKNDRAMDAIIVGGGFSGIDIAIKLQRANIPFTLLEKNQNFGGTWLLNTYPGCACDVPAHLYSYSYELNPNWSKPYAEQEEILDYIIKVAKKYDLEKYTRFGIEVKEATWMEEQRKWHVTCNDGSVYTPRLLFSAVGALHHPKYPDVEGRETFKGISLHSAMWDKSVDCTGKKVVVIGSAASAVQIIPRIANIAKEVYVVQRTPNWIVPQESPVLPKVEGYSERMKSIFNNIPMTLRFHRWMIYCFMEATFTPLGLFGDPKSSTWSRNAQKISSATIKKYMNSRLGDSSKANELRDKVIPKYPVGCKRIIRSQVYLQSLVKENVHLKCNLPKLVKENSIVLDNGEEIEADILIWATGFEVGSLGKLKITGNDNQMITGSDLIDKGIEAYYGMSIPKYPNLFIVLGPNTGLGHNSIIFMIENQVDYIMKLVQEMKNRKANRIEVKQAVLDEHAKWLHDSLSKTVWNGHCNSWYQGNDGKIPTLWPSSTISYWYSLLSPNLSDYTFASSKQGQARL